MKASGGRHEDWLGEEYRQVVHAAFGAAVMISAILFGADLTMLVLLSVFCVFLFLVSWSMSGKKSHVFDFLMNRFERNVEIPGKGAMMYTVGVLFLLTFSPNLAFALAAIGILAFGDSVSTLVGLRGSRHLPWNAGKTWEGLVGFVVVSAVISYPLIGLMGVAYAVLLGLAETIPWQLDDNLVISVGAVLLNLVLK